MTCHAHKCSCGHEWCHSDKWAREASTADYEKGHTCTECGREQTYRSAAGLRSCDKLPVLEPANHPKRASAPTKPLTMKEILGLITELFSEEPRAGDSR